MAPDVEVCAPRPLQWWVLHTYFIFSAETRIEIAESVRGKDVFILQTGGG